MATHIVSGHNASIAEVLAYGNVQPGDSIDVQLPYAHPVPPTYRWIDVNINDITFNVPAGVTGAPIVLRSKVAKIDLQGDGPVEIVGDGDGDIDETFTGNQGNNTFGVEGGQDTIDGGGGDDLLVVYYSGHSIIATSGSVVSGDHRVDYSNIERLVIWGSAFDDFLQGGAGADTLGASGGNDTILGEGGDDLIYASYNSGAVDGGSGIDTVRSLDLGSVTFSNVEILDVDDTNGGQHYVWASIAQLLSFSTITDTDASGPDSLIKLYLRGDGGTIDLSGRMAGSHGTDVEDQGLTGAIAVTGSLNNDILNGSAFDDVLNGGAGNDVIDGGWGDDVLNGGAGNDTLNGGRGGSDTASYAGATGGVRVKLSLTSAQDTQSAGSDTLANISNLFGSAFNDQLTGDGFGNMLTGGDGNDTLLGGGGDDTLDGGAGGDRMEGGLGNDTYHVGTSDKVVEKPNEGIDTVITRLTEYSLGAGVENLTYAGTDKFKGTGNALDNTITGGGNADTIDGGAGNDTLQGGGGIDTLLYKSATAGVTVSLLVAGAQNTDGSGTDTLDGFENVTGSGHADTLTGDGGVNILRGVGGNDVLDGSAGADTMEGGLGNDSYFIDDTGDKAVEKAGEGTDTVFTTLSSLALGAGVENLVFNGTGDFAGTGNALANTITGGAGDDVLAGGTAADVLNGGGGTDIASYATATAAVKGSLSAPGTNTGDAAGDVYNSIEGLLGSRFADTLTGDGGANRLAGGGGLDTITGGAGADTFVFNRTLVAGNAATVTDFIVGTDTFELSLGVFTAAGSAGTLSADAFHLGATAADATDRILYDSATGKLFYDADGTGATAARLFATVSTGLVLDEHSFLLA